MSSQKRRPDPPPDDLVGTVLAGRYRILRLLGTGAMGAVYLGEHLKIGRHDAIKVLRTSMERDPEAIARFTRGARNASAIRHPNVCTVYDFGETDAGLAFLAMEYVEGEQLSDILARERRLDPERAVRLGLQVCEALQAAHHLGIVHRDLKPGNIMVGRNRNGGDLVKVVDFDIAKGGVETEEDEVTRMGFVVGTPEYMSPEQLTGDSLDGRSDLYSLALVLFKAVTGGYPFDARSTQDMMVQKLTESPRPASALAPGLRIPPPLQNVFDRAIRRKPSDRFETAAAMASALEAVLEQEAAPPGERPPPPLPPTETVGSASVPPTVQTGDRLVTADTAGSEGRRRWAVALGAVALVIGTGAGWWILAADGGSHRVEIEAESLDLSVGERTRVRATVADPSGAEMDEAVVQWATPTDRVISVGATGLVTALEPGEALLVASFEGAADTARLVVRETIEDVRVGLDPSTLELSAVAGTSGDAARVRLVDAESLDRISLSARTDDGTAPDWLNAAEVDEANGRWIEVHADARQLTAGEYSASVLVRASENSLAAELPVRLTVAERTGPDPPDEIVVAMGEVDGVLSRQLGHLTGSGGPPANAVRDTVTAVLAVPGLSTTQRARGLYVLASALWEAGEACPALRHAEDAVAVEPSRAAYVTLRDQLRELCR